MWQEMLSFILGAFLASLLFWRMSRRWIRRRRANDRNLLNRTRRVEKLAELGVLTGHLAHEIRNPLSTIKMNLQLLSEDIHRLAESAKQAESSDGIDTPEQHYRRQLHKLDTLMRETDRLAETLNDFMRYAGRIELHPAQQDVNELLDDLVDFYEPQALSKGVRIRLSLSKKPLICRVDGDLLKQAILNLLINAVQVMENDGELIIRSREQGGEVKIDVIDTGPGIAQQEQEKVFDAYYTSRAGGTGLGLAICRRIIEEHKGHVELHSEQGKGSNFVIILPLVKQLNG